MEYYLFCPREGVIACQNPKTNEITKQDLSAGMSLGFYFLFFLWCSQLALVASAD